MVNIIVALTLKRPVDDRMKRTQMTEQPLYDRIVIEVGANTGRDTERLATPDTFVYAFEPSPILYPELVQRFRDRKNILILPFAVDLKNDVVEFNVADVGDRGVGSLYNYHPDMATNAVGQHPVFKAGFVWKQNVATIRLDAFMRLYEISHIDYLHIDAQGSDFRVIQSLGYSISKVREGVCECTYKVPLYVDSDILNNYDDCMMYLNLHGFDAEITYVHENNTEVDIHFKRR